MMQTAPLVHARDVKTAIGSHRVLTKVERAVSPPVVASQLRRGAHGGLLE